jgi:hypothetical protein
MAPGTWKAPEENDAPASTGGVAYCRRPQAPVARRRSADVSYWPAVCLGQGE